MVCAGKAPGSQPRRHREHSPVLDLSDQAIELIDAGSSPGWQSNSVGPFVNSRQKSTDRRNLRRDAVSPSPPPRRGYTTPRRARQRNRMRTSASHRTHGGSRSFSTRPERRASYVCSMPTSRQSDPRGKSVSRDLFHVEHMNDQAVKRPTANAEAGPSWRRLALPTSRPRRLIILLG
jgi:hypothetical protein